MNNRLKTILEINNASLPWYVVSLGIAFIINKITNDWLSRIGLPMPALVGFVIVSGLLSICYHLSSSIFPKLYKYKYIVISGYYLFNVIQCLRAWLIRFQIISKRLLQNIPTLLRRPKFQTIAKYAYYIFIPVSIVIIIYELSSNISWLWPFYERYLWLDQIARYAIYSAMAVGCISFFKIPSLSKISDHALDTLKYRKYLSRFNWGLIIIGLIYYAIQIFSGPFGPDDGHMLYEMDLIRQGYIPFRDFQTQGLLYDLIFFPITYLPYFGHWIFTYRMIGILVHLVTLFFIYRIAKKISPFLIPFVTLYFFFTPPLALSRYIIVTPAHLMALFYTAGMYFTLVFVEQAKTKVSINRAILCGLLFLGAGFSRSSAFFYGIVSALFAFFVVYPKLYLKKQKHAILAIIGLIITLTVIYCFDTFFRLPVFDRIKFIILNFIHLEKNTIGGYAGWNSAVLKELIHGQWYLLIPIIIFILKFTLNIKNALIKNLTTLYVASFIILGLYLNWIFNFQALTAIKEGPNPFFDFFFHQIGFIFVLYILLLGIEKIIKRSLPEKLKYALIGTLAILILIKNRIIIMETIVFYGLLTALGLAIATMIVFWILYKNKRHGLFSQPSLTECYLFTLFGAFLFFYTYIYSSVTSTYFISDLSPITILISSMVIFQLFCLLRHQELRNYFIVILLIYLSFSTAYPIYRKINTPYGWQSELPPVQYYNETIQWLKQQPYIKDEVFSGNPLFPFGLEKNNIFHISHTLTYWLYPEPNYIRAQFKIPSEEELIAYMRQHPEVLYIDEPAGRMYIRFYLKKFDRMLESEYCVVKYIGDGYIKIYRAGACNIQPSIN